MACRPLILAALPVLLLAGCGHPATPARPSAEVVFDAVAPSVVAISNDDSADREKQIAALEKRTGTAPHGPKRVIDVSAHRQATPDGTGFMVAGGLIVTAAHVVELPDKLFVTTRAGKRVPADLVHLDEVRDIAVLRPRTPLPEVPPLKLEEHDLRVGEPVWALGHTGRGYWALSWGMSEGIASGIVDMMGAKLLLFDAAVYPGFSGGPVVTFHDHGHAEVAGVNHAILYTGMSETSTSPIFSAVAVSELHEVLAGHPPPIQKALLAYAKKERTRVFADLFITSKFQIKKDEDGHPVAHIVGDTRSIQIGDPQTTIPAVAMLFGFAPGTSELRFEARDPAGDVVATAKTSAKVATKQRVAFASADLSFVSKKQGRYLVSVRKGGAVIGQSFVEVQAQGADEVLHDDPDVSDGDPNVDVVVTRHASASPLVLAGVESYWTARSFPRRVPFTWFARGSRGWSGRDVIISAYVLDDAGNVVGHSEGCFEPELRPELAWSCLATGGMMPPPLAPKAGSYDIVFTVNDRPVGWWPMEAVLRKDGKDESDTNRWLEDLRRAGGS